MPHAGDFAVGSCQATLFTPEADVSPTRFVTRFLGEWGDRFDAEPTIIPFPEGIPKEVPKIILESRNQQWRCEVASARMNLFWRRPRRAACLCRALVTSTRVVTSRSSEGL